MKKKDKSYTLGLWGEELTAAYLQERGYRILNTRWHCRYGELDVVAEDGSYLCFVEVKLRKNADLGPARSFITTAKQKKLQISAQLYLMEHPSSLQPRFDVMEVYAPRGRQTEHPELIYWENAF